MKILLAILFLFTLNSARAELYKSIGEDGEVIYSDKPPTENAQDFKPPEIQVTPPVKIPPKKQPPVTQQATPYPYSDIRFTQPEADANFFDNEGNIRYALSITPALNTKLGHYLNIKLDGTALASKTSSMTGELKEIERGSPAFSVFSLSAHQEGAEKLWTVLVARLAAAPGEFMPEEAAYIHALEPTPFGVKAGALVAADVLVVLVIWFSPKLKD